MRKAYIEAFSAERLNPYRRYAKVSSDLLEVYLWNIALSEALFPVLALFEVTLRNRTDAAIVGLYPNWLEASWIGWGSYKHKAGHKQKESRNIELEQLNKALGKLSTDASRGKLVAELNLGFWIGLFKGHYNPVIWFKKEGLSMIFPHLPSSISKQRTPTSVLFPKMRQLLKLRNRIFHHEPIFNWPEGLDLAHQSLCDLLEWMSPEVAELLLQMDRFKPIWEEHAVPTIIR